MPRKPLSGLLFWTILAVLLSYSVNARDQDWIVSGVPASFPKLVPFDGESQEQEIWGGMQTRWADLMALRIPENAGENEHLCSGILLRSDAILTAAHCMCSQGQTIARAPFVASAAGAHLTKLSAWREAADYELFPGWSCAAMGHVSDLAVVFLTPRAGREPSRNLQRINGTKRTKPFGKCRPRFASKSWDENVLQLADMLAGPPPRTLSVGGFGLDEYGRKGSPLEVDLQVTSLACTSRATQLRWCRPFSEMILGAGSRDRGIRDSCGGDSGGPAYWESADGVRHLVGIVSRGVPPLPGEPRQSCGLGGIYTLVGRPRVTAWLKGIGVEPEDVCQ